MTNIISRKEMRGLVDRIKRNKNLTLILESRCKNGNSLLHVLINEGDLEGFKSMMCIIKEISKTNMCLVKKILNMTNKAGDTPAHIAVRKSDNKNNEYSIIVETLQSVGADLTIANKNNEVIVQTGDPPYNKEEIQKQKYINSCVFDTIDNETSEDLDNIETINSPLNSPSNFPFKLDILVVNQKKNIQQQPQEIFKQNKEQEMLQQLEQQLRERFRQRQVGGEENKKKAVYEEEEKKNIYGGEEKHKTKYGYGYGYGGEEKKEFYGGGEKDKTKYGYEEEKKDFYEGEEKKDFYGGGSGGFKGKRKINNPYVSNGGSKISEKNHNDAIQKIRKLGYSEEEATDVKNFLYYEIKDNFPGLNNDERSEKFSEVLKTFELMDIKKVRKELEKYRERNNKNAPPKKEHQKEHQKEPKKESKKVKKSSKRTSKRTSKKTSKKSSLKKRYSK
jgi:hypothetical protein